MLNFRKALIMHYIYIYICIYIYIYIKEDTKIHYMFQPWLSKSCVTASPKGQPTNNARIGEMLTLDWTSWFNTMLTTAIALFLGANFATLFTSVDSTITHFSLVNISPPCISPPIFPSIFPSLPPTTHILHHVAFERELTLCTSRA